MVAGRAARPPGSAPGCQSGRESNRSPLGVSVPASFIGPRRKTQGEEVEATKTLSNTCSRVKRRVFCLSLYVYPDRSNQIGLTRYVYPDRSNQRRIGGRVHPGRNFVSEATTRCFEWLLENPNHIPEREQPLRRSRTGDEREPSGFPLIPQ